MKFETYKKEIDYHRAVLMGDRQPVPDLTPPQRKAFKGKSAPYTMTDEPFTGNEK